MFFEEHPKSRNLPTGTFNLVSLRKLCWPDFWSVPKIIKSKKTQWFFNVFTRKSWKLYVFIYFLGLWGVAGVHCPGLGRGHWSEKKSKKTRCVFRCIARKIKKTHVKTPSTIKIICCVGSTHLFSVFQIIFRWFS